MNIVQLKTLSRAQWWSVLALMFVVASITCCVAMDRYGTSCGRAFKQARLDINNIDQAVQQYQIMNNRRLPGNLDELAKQKFLPKISKDPWNKPYYYFLTANNDYVIFSAGPDNIALTSDDITFEP